MSVIVIHRLLFTTYMETQDPNCNKSKSTRFETEWIDNKMNRTRTFQSFENPQLRSLQIQQLLNSLRMRKIVFFSTAVKIRINLTEQLIRRLSYDVN